MAQDINAWLHSLPRMEESRRLVLEWSQISEIDGDESYNVDGDCQASLADHHGLVDLRIQGRLSYSTDP